MKRYIRSSEISVAEVHLSDVLKRVVCIKFCGDLNREPTKLSESSRIYADNEMESFLPDDNLFMTYSDSQLLGMYADEKTKIQMESLTKPELLLRLYHLCKDNLTPLQLSILHDKARDSKVQIEDADVEDLLTKMHKCKNIQYDGAHAETNLFIMDEDGNIRTKDCLSVISELTISNWIDEMNGEDPEYLCDILVVFQIHDNWVGHDGEVFKDLCIYIKVDLNQTTGDSILLVTMHPDDHDDNLD